MKLFTLLGVLIQFLGLISSPNADDVVKNKTEIGSMKKVVSQCSSSNSQDIYIRCPSCDTCNTRKKYTKCDNCHSRWHLTCVGLTRKQAEALSTWWCPKCTSYMSCRSQSEQRNPSQLADDTLPSCDNPLADSLSTLRQTRQVVQRIPRGARIAAADALTQLLETAVESKTTEAMTKLFLFPRHALTVPSWEDGASDSIDKSSHGSGRLSTER